MRGNADMIGDGPGVKFGHPGADQIPGAAVIGADAGLGQQFGGGNAPFMDVAAPQAVGKGETLIKINLRAPFLAERVNVRI